MMNSLCKLGFSALVIGSLITGCASSNSGSVYKRDETRQAQTVRMGVVESVRQVSIEGTKSPVGTIAGGVIGAVAGSRIGGGSAKVITGTLGAVAGALAGSAVEEKVTQKNGLEITVKLDNGSMIAVVQEATEEFHAGDRIRVLDSGGVTRITH
jgi:outer membrane lipoprotein SlyB